MFKKSLLVAGIVAAVVAVILFMTAIMPTLLSLIGFAQADPLAGNYSGYSYALGAAPLWLYLIPVAIGGIAVIVVLRSPERR